MVEVRRIRGAGLRGGRGADGSALEARGGGEQAARVLLLRRGEELAAVCGRWLQGARERLDAALARDTADEQADGQEERGGGQRQAADGAAAEDGGDETGRVVFP